MTRNRFLSDRRKASTASLAAVLLSFSIVGSTGSAGGATVKKPVGDRSPIHTNVTIGISNPNAAQYLPYLVQAAGFFAKENISATVVTIAPAVWVADIAAGAIQFGVGSPTALEVAVLTNYAPVKLLATWTLNSQIEILGGPGIHSIADLKGKRVGLSAPGSTTNTLISYLMGQAGLSSSDYIGVPQTSSAGLNAAFIGGQIDAVPTAPPLDKVLLAAVPGSSVIHNFASDKTFLWPQAEIAGNAKWIGSHQKATIAVLGAMQLGLKYWNTHATAAEASIGANIVGLTSDQIAAAWTASQQVFLKNLVAVPVAVENNVIGLMNLNGYPTASANAARLRAMISTTYIKTALRNLGIK